MAFDFSTLVTDRSPEDLQALRDLLATPMADWTAEQRAQFNLAVSKGAYNYTDLNRVIAAMDDINERLTQAGYVTGYQRIQIHEAPAPEPPPKPEEVALPDGYTRLEYIESNGEQYIDTGFIPNQDTQLVGDFTVKSTANAAAGTGFIPYGAAYTYNSRAFELYTTNGQFEINYDGQANFIGTVQLDQEININHNKNVVSIIQQDGTSINTTFAYQSFTAPYTLTLFAINRGTAACGLARLHTCKIYNSGTLIRDFVPCKDASNVAGLYDLANYVFYQNAGTGSFAAGPEVQPVPDPEPEPVLEPYTWYESDAPTQAQMTQYLANAEALKGALTLADNAPELPLDMDGLTTQEANNIEEILTMINLYLLTLQKIFLRSGMAWAVSGGPGFYFAN